MSKRRDPTALRLCLTLVRLFGAIVPGRWRADWQAEWEAEVRHRWESLDRRHRLDWRAQMDLVRRAFGAFPDAAWLRRQFTSDADIVHDVRHGVRTLRQSPAFTLAAVAILALGMGGTVSIASMLDTLIFRPLPYEDADSIVTVWQRHAARGGVREDVAPANFLDWRDRATSFTALAAAIPYSYDYTGGGEPEVFFGAQVTEGFWDALGIRPILGRTFMPEEHVRGARRVVVISHGLWQRKFGGDRAILNRAISFDGIPFTVVGVLPSEFAPQLLPRPGELGVWTPKVIQEHEPRVRASAWWNVVGRVKPGLTIEQAQAEMDAISRELGREHPRTNDGLSVLLVPMREHLMGGLRLPLLLMLGAVVLVLGIGCINVASLLFARGIQREREFAIRSALGAGRGRLVRQLVAESLLLSAVAAAAGVALAHWGLRLIVALAPGGVLRLRDAAVDGRMLAFAVVITIVTALAFGLIPALQFSRFRHEIRERQSTGPKRIMRRALIAAEIAFALVLLTGAGLLLRSFSRLLAVDPGFSASRVVALQVFAHDRNETPDKVRSFFAASLDRIRALPGVEQAGAVSAMPFMIANIDIKSALAIVGRDTAADAQRGAYLTIAMPGYFEAMSIPLREGRLLDGRDTEKSPRVAVITESLRRRDWPSESPIGRRIRLQWEGAPIEVEIAGVVSDIRHDGLDRAARPEVFVPLPQVPFTSMTYVVRGRGREAALIEAVKREVWALDPLQTFYDVATVEGLVDASVVSQRFSVTLMSSFAALALILCAVGVYGLISFTTLLRTREIGVRMALGADGGTIRRMVLGEGAVLVVTGLVLGLAGAIGASRLLQSLLFEVRPGDPLTFVAAVAILGGVGLAACYIPARRATRVDPLVALRVD
jgi:putative ABC transport system permease protein